LDGRYGALGGSLNAQLYRCARSIQSLAEPLDGDLEYGLYVGCRLYIGHDLSGSQLAPGCPLGVGEQSGVLNGNAGLASKGLEQQHIGLIIGGGSIAVHIKDSNDVAFDLDWHY
jgi:hypothetical protein